jgi:ATP-dependent Lon protease
MNNSDIEKIGDLVLPALPLRNSLLFPNLTMPVSVSRDSSIAAVEAALSTEDKLIAIFAQKEQSVETPKEGDIYEIGTVGFVKRMHRREGAIHMMVQGMQRIECKEIVQKTPYLSMKVSYIPDPKDFDHEVEALQRTMLDLARKVIELSAFQASWDIDKLLSEVRSPIQQSYVLASLLSIDIGKYQALLAVRSQREALELIISYLGHEIQILEIQNKIASDTQSKMDKQQRDFILRQQLRSIEEELGETTPEHADIEELKNKSNEVKLPEYVKKQIDKELGRLERMSSVSPDYQLTRSYLELVIELPWHETTEDSYDLDRARKILDEAHFDLEDVKQRILEHLAVMKLNPAASSPIICFVGPPGVGKTSLGQSIAKALNRKFERMSLGGLHDEAELRGHRRTYIGAMPGRIIHAIHRVGVRNPLLMLDEVDKLGHDFRGDPAAALMEILDPEQNREFRDNYLDLPFDLSNIFFIVTANTLDTIPTPLLDRLEIINLSGYSDQEKLEIAKRYLIQRSVKKSGIGVDQVTLPDETITEIIRKYTRESGVRNLERTIEKIMRKIAIQVAQGKNEQFEIQPYNLVDLLGPPKFAYNEYRESLPPGVAAGLAWTPVGGEILYIESALLPDGKDLMITGQLGSVMQESAKAARSYLWSHAEQLKIDENKINKAGVHIHVPAGATPKDGPSAGVTMAASLASLYLQSPVRHNTAMTGEITLTGLVLPVGGIKEKVLAAHRAGMARVIMPKANENDLRELPKQILDKIEFILVENVQEVLTHAMVLTS